jgi:dTDP-4-amino-4,6-dideoxygalactose transaminase
VAFVRPPAPPRDAVFARLAPSYDAGQLTNGPLVRELEAATARLFDVEHVVAVSSCTIGLMLVLRVLEPKGDVLLPSFTFSASAHSVAWNALGTRFAECDPFSFQLDLADAKERLAGDGHAPVGAILATHVFGAPCDPAAVEALGAGAGVPVVFDAAHGFGARTTERRLGGYGVAEVFSLTPTKPVVAGEGGLVATSDASLAAALRIGRDYGNPGDYNTRFVGLNGRMSEMHAAVALCSLDGFEENQQRRLDLAARYQGALAQIDGVRVQQIREGDVSTFKDFTIAVDAERFGATRDVLVRALSAEGIDTRNYFDPPVHRQQSHAAGAPDLPVTDSVSSSVVSLPIYPALAESTLDGIVECIARIGRHGAACTAVS